MYELTKSIRDYSDAGLAQRRSDLQAKWNPDNLTPYELNELDKAIHTVDCEIDKRIDFVRDHAK